MGEIIIEWLLFGLYAIIMSIYNWIKGLIYGIPKEQIERKQLEKKWLYKRVALKRDQKNGLKKGEIGVLMEFIDKKHAFVEFYNEKGSLREIGGELAFKVKLYELRLKK